MYTDDQSIKQFERMHARDRLAEEARHIGENDDAALLGGHLAGEREAQRLMRPIAMAAVAMLTVLLFYLATG
jgi:hypothetical protein